MKGHVWVLGILGICVDNLYFKTQTTEKYSIGKCYQSSALPQFDKFCVNVDKFCPVIESIKRTTEI